MPVSKREHADGADYTGYCCRSGGPLWETCDSGQPYPGRGRFGKACRRDGTGNAYAGYDLETKDIQAALRYAAILVAGEELVIAA